MPKTTKIKLKEKCKGVEEGKPKVSEPAVWRSPITTRRQKGFLNNSVFTSPKKETTLKGLEECRRHFRTIRLQDINGHVG